MLSSLGQSLGTRHKKVTKPKMKLACPDCNSFLQQEKLGIWVIVTTRNADGLNRPERLYRADVYSCKCRTVIAGFGSEWSNKSKPDFAGLITMILAHQDGDFVHIHKA